MNIKIPNNSVSNGNKKEQLEYREKVLSLVRKADDKRLSKRKGLTEAYKHYYIDDVRENFFFPRPWQKKHIICCVVLNQKMYEIEFALGFSVIMDTRGKNAIVSSIQNA
ncbi:hypothetical protein RFI_38761 [Reticulomyxa filosa]|uniref:Uncharacterized protein n=1 Tax=Reticulomyxa filosa TaxID=46433 RepID=X6LD91_RETFI|nr:hypothetical protein RFI_38761 [Reticulomyxa filosa]|eukprot:ETN98719.1 hypothetical protein RFI_38761 [Reticulomyxa filosa]